MVKAFKFSLLLLVIILILSLISLGSIPKVHVRAGDKIGHFLAYAALCFTFLVEYAAYTRWSTRIGRWLIYSALAFCLYGVLMEFLQASSLANRNFDYYDMLANSIGVIAGLSLFQLLFNVLKKRFIK